MQNLIHFRMPRKNLHCSKILLLVSISNSNTPLNIYTVKYTRGLRRVKNNL